jgi:hypothetical protein
MKRNVSSALNKSLREEEKAVKDRFERAETALSVRPAARKKPSPEYEIVRDSFTFPDFDYRLIEELKLRAAKMGILSNKGEVLRAGLRVLSELSDANFAETLQRVVKIKAGRRTDK